LGRFVQAVAVAAMVVGALASWGWSDTPSPASAADAQPEREWRGTIKLSGSFEGDAPYPDTSPSGRTVHRSTFSETVTIRRSIRDRPLKFRLLWDSAYEYTYDRTDDWTTVKNCPNGPVTNTHHYEEVGLRGTGTDKSFRYLIIEPAAGQATLLWSSLFFGGASGPGVYEETEIGCDGGPARFPFEAHAVINVYWNRPVGNFVFPITGARDSSGVPLRLAGSLSIPAQVVGELNLELQGTLRVDYDLRLVRPGKLKANAGKDRTVRRGKTVTFDGSRSTGNIKSYRWTYELDRGCPKNLADPKVKDKGATVTATMLCSAVATLKVTSPSGKSKTDKVEIDVLPREGSAWRVPVTFTTQHFGPSPLGPPFAGEDDILGWNTCDRPPEYRDTGPFCPSKRRSWKGLYTVGKVHTNGPFAGWAYVTAASGFKLHRVLFLNDFILPGGPPPSKFPGAESSWATRPGGNTNFYDYNSALNHAMSLTTYLGTKLRGRAALEWLIDKFVVRHEGMGLPGIEQSGHMQTLIVGVTTAEALGDPRRYLETAFDPSSAELVKRVGACLEKADIAIDDYSDDPLVLTPRNMKSFEWSKEKRKYVLAKGNFDPYVPHPLNLPKGCLRPPLR
jgi:hypothetical protein